MKTATKERPIIFSGPMVRAILNGHKTQTRRVAKPQPLSAGPIPCPYGRVGDRLYVKERWKTINVDCCTMVHYKADGAIMSREFPSAEIGWKAEQDAEAIDADRWNNSLFMPRWASRITLEITDVRVQRVQEISEEDAIAEGAVYVDGELTCSDSRIAFCKLWDSINAKRGHGWDANPWVWAITFKRVEQEARDGR